MNNKFRSTLRRVYVVACFLLLSSPLFADTWYDGAWRFRQEISVAAADYGSVAVTDLPLLVSFTGANSLFSRAKSNGYDILFTDSNGTKLDHEIEVYTASGGSGTLTAWVRIPSLPASGTTTLYLYYGNSAATNQQNPTGVWDSGYQLVHHLNEETPGTSGTIHYDSTENAYNGTQNNNVRVAARIAGGQEFADNRSISLDNVPTNSWTGFTVEMWVRPTTFNGGFYCTAFSKAVDGSNAGTVLKLAANNVNTQFTFSTDHPVQGSKTWIATADVLTLNTTYHFVAVWNGSQFILYRNGVPLALTSLVRYAADGTTLENTDNTSPYDTTGFANTLKAAVGQVFLLGNLPAGDRGWRGWMDEPRFSNTSRSAAWVTASYTNQNTPKGAGTEQVFLGGRVYADAGLTPLAGATVQVLVDGAAVAGTVTSDANGYWGKGVPSATLASAGQRISAYINAASPNGGAVVSVWGGSNLHDLDIYRGSLVVRHDNGGNPSVADINAARGATLGNFPVTASNATSATFAAYSLFIPAGVQFTPGDGTSLTAGAVAGSGSYTAGTGALSVAGSFAPGSFDAGTGSVSFTGTGSTGTYSFYNLTLNGGTRTANGPWTVTNSLTLTSGTWNPGAFTHNVAGNWNSGGITFAPTEGTIRLTGAGNIASATNFWNLTIAGATRTLAASPVVRGNLTIESGASLAVNDWRELSIHGNWDNQAGASGFNATDGRVLFVNSAVTSVVRGNTTFRDFYSNDAGKILAFEAGSTQSVTTTLAIGQNASLVRFGGSGSDQWNFNVTAAIPSIQDVKVGDSNASPALSASGNSINLGNNTGWSGFSAGAVTWDGSEGDGLWATGANWSGGSAPIVTSTVLIPSGIGNYPTVSATTAVQDLTVAPDAWMEHTNGIFDVYNQYDLQGNLYRQAFAAGTAEFNRTDTNSGTVIYQGTGGLIQNYNASGTADYFNLEIDSWGETFTVPAGQELYVAGDLVITAGTLDLSVNNNALRVTGNLSVSGTGAIRFGTGAIQVDGTVSGSGSISAGSATITVSGNWQATNFIRGTSTLILSGASASLAAGSYHNLTIDSGAGVYTTGTVSVNANLTADGAFTTGSYDLSVQGTAGGTGSITSGTGSLSVNGAFTPASYAMGAGSASFASNFGPTAFSADGGTVLFIGTTALGRAYTFNNITINPGASLDSAGFSIAIDGIFQNKGTLYRRGGDSVSKTDATQGTTIYRTAGGAIQSYSGDDYHNLSFEGAFVYTSANDLSVTGSVSIGAGSTLALGSSRLQVAGSWTNNGTAAVGGTVELTGSGTATISGTTTFTRLESSVAGKSITLAGTQTIATGGSFAISGAAGSLIALGGGTINLTGTATATANHAAISNSTVTTGTGSAFYSTLSGTTTGWTQTGSTYYWVGVNTNPTVNTNWELNGVTGVGTPGPNDAVIVQSGFSELIVPAGLFPTAPGFSFRSLIIEENAVVNVNNNYITIVDNFENYGILRRATQTATDTRINRMDVNNGTVEYITTGAGNFVQDFGSQDYHNLTLSVNVTLNFALTVNGNLNIQAGTLNANGRTLTVGGNFSRTGTFTHGNGTVIFSDASRTSTLSGNTTFYRLSSATPGKTINFGATTQTIATGGSLTIQGSSASPISLIGTGWNLNWATAGDAAGANVEYASISNSTVSTATTANSSVNGGGNINWTFTPGPGYFIWTGAAADGGLWSNLANWNTIEPDYPGAPAGVANPTVIIPAVSGPNVPPLLNVNISTNPLGDLSIEAGASLDIAGQTLSVSGTFNNEGTLYREALSSMNVVDTNSGQVVYRGATNGTIQDYGSGFDYWQLETAGSARWTLGANLSVADTLSIGANTTLASGTRNLSVAGTSAIDGSLEGGSGTISLNGAVTVGAAGNFQASSGATRLGAGLSITAGGSFAHNGGSVTLGGPGSLTGVLAFNNVTLNTSGTVTLINDIDVTGNLVLTAGTLNLNGHTLELGGNISRTSGSFNAGTNGTVALVDNNNIGSIGSSITWPNLSITTAGKTVRFQAGSTQTVSGTFTVTGTSGNAVVLDSSAASAWTLTLSSAAATVSYVNVSYSTMTGSYGVTANNSINGGNNTITAAPASNPGWLFPRSSSFTWTGGAGSSDWTDPNNWAEGNGLHYPGHDGAGPTTTTTDEVAIPAGMTYWPTLAAPREIANLNLAANAQLTLNAALTVNTATTNGGTIIINNAGSLSQGDGNAANGGTVIIALTGNRTLASAVSDNALTNLTVTGGFTLDADAAFGASGNVSLGSGTTLSLSAATGVYTIGGNLTGTGTSTVNASVVTGGSLGIGGTLGSAGTALGTVSAPAALSLDGSINVNTFTHNNGTVTMTGPSTILGAWTAAGKRFNNLTINPGAGNTVTLGGAQILAGSLSLQSGTLDVSASNYGISMNGDWDNAVGAAGFTARNGSVTILNTTNQTHAVTGSTNFYNLTSTIGSAVSATLTFDAGETIGISGALNLQGNSTANRLRLESAASPTDWILNLALGTGHTVNYLNVVNSDLRGAAFSPAPANSIGSGNDDPAGVNPPSWGLAAPVFVWQGNAGATGTHWSVAANWSEGTVPGTGNDVLIPTAPANGVFPVLDAGVGGSVTVVDLEIESGASLSLQGADLAWTILTKDAGATILLYGDETLTDAAALLGSGAVNYNAPSGTYSVIDVDPGAGDDYANLIVSGAATYTTTDDIRVSNSLSLSGTGATSFNGVLVAPTVTLAKTGGSASFTGTLTVATAFTTDATDNTFNLSITGTGSAITPNVVFTNDGTLQLGDAAGDSLTFTGGLSTTAVTGTVNLAGSINSNDAALIFGPVTLVANTTLDSNATATNTANITLGAVTGNTFDLTLETGYGIANADIIGTNFASSGALTLQNIGGTAGFTGAVSAGSLSVTDTVVNVALTGISGTITNPVEFHNSGTLVLGQNGGIITFAGGIETAGNATNPTTVTLNGTIATTNTAITLGNITLGSTVTLDSNATTAAGAINVGTVTSSNAAYAFTADAATSGAVSLGAIGTAGAGADDPASVTVSGSTLTLANVYSHGAQAYTGATSITLNGTEYQTLSDTAGAESLTFNGNVLLGQNVAMSTIGLDSSDSIEFNGTVNDDAGSSDRTLTLDAGAGSVSFTGIIGGTTAPLGVTVSDAASVDFGASTTIGASGLNVTTSGGTITQTAGSALVIAGTTTLTAFDGVAAYYDITLDNTGNDFGGTVTATGANITLTDTDDITLGNIAATSGIIEVSTSTVGAGSFITVAGTVGTSTTTGISLNTAGSSVAPINLASGGFTSNSGTATLSDTTVLSSTGTFTLTNTTLVCEAGLALTATGTLAAGTNAVRIAGDLTRTNGSLTSGGTLTFDGGAQTADFSGSTLTNVTVGDGVDDPTDTTLRLASALTLSGTLTILQYETLDTDVANNFGITTASWTNNGSFVANNGTVTFSGIGTLGGSAQTSFSTVHFDGDTTFTQSFAAATALTIDSDDSTTGTRILADGGTNLVITIGGDWTNNDGFTAGDSTVFFTDDADHTIVGSTTFYNLEMDASGAGAARTLTFTDGTTQTIAAGGNLTLLGTSGQLLTLTGSGVMGWTIDLQNTATTNVQFVNVSYGNADTNSIAAATSRDSGNNDTDADRWIFTPASIRWTGVDSASWNLGTNWQHGYVPNVTDNVIFQTAGVTNNLNVNGLNATTARVNDVTITGGTIDAAGAGTIRVDGSISVSGTPAFSSAANLTWDMRGSSAALSGVVAINIGNIRIDPGATNSITLGADTQVNNLLLQSGTLAANTRTFSVAGNISDNSDAGALTFTSGTLTLNGSANTQNVDLSQATLSNLTIDNSFATTPQVIASSNISLSGNLALNGGTLAMGANQVSLTGATSSITNDGITAAATGGGGFTSTGIISFSGTGTQTADFRASTLTSATISTASKASGSLSFPWGFTVGTFTTAASNYAVSFNTTTGSGGESTTITAATSFLNTGTLSIGNENTDTLIVTGGITANGTGTNSYRGTLATGGGAGQDILLDDLGISGGTLVLDAGAGGIISVTGATAGTGFNLSIANSNGTIFGGAVGSNGNALGTVTITDTSVGQTVAFNGGLYASNLSTTAQTYNLSIGAGAMNQTSVVGSLTGGTPGHFNHTGSLVLGNTDGDSITFTGGVVDASSVSGIQLAGTITSSATALNLNDTIILNANTTLSSGTGALTAGGTVNSSIGNTYSLTLNSTGITTLGAAGATDALLSLTTDANGSTSLQSVRTTQGITIGDNVTLNDSLTVTSAGYGVTLSGTTTLNAGGGTITLTGNNANNDITFTGAVNGAQALNLTATGGDILFSNQVGNSDPLTGITVTAANTLRFNNTLALGASGLDVTATNTYFANNVSTSGGGNITLNGASNLTASAALSIDTNDTSDGTFSFGTGTLTATAGNLSLDLGTSNFTARAGSNFGTVVIVSVNDITLNDTNGIILGTSTIGGTLAVNAGGTITDSGNLSITGTTTLNTSAAAVVTLDNNNNFGGAVTANGSITNLTLNDTGAIRFASVDINGNLVVTAAGQIDQTGAILVDGTSSLTAGNANDITLNNTSNNFGNTVTVVSGNNVTLVDTDAISLGNIAAAGTIDIRTYTDNAASTITVAGAIGTATTPSITLNTATNAAGASVAPINLASGSFTTNGGTVTLEDRAVLTGATFTLNAPLDCNESLALSAAGSINAGTRQVFVAGNLDRTNGSISFTTGTLTLDGTTAQNANLENSTIRNLVINKTSGSAPSNVATLTNTTAFTWSGDLTLTAGTLVMANLDQTIAGSVTGAGSLTAPSTNTLTIGGATWSPSGFTAGSGTVAFTGTTSIASSNTFHNLTKSTGGTLTLNESPSVTHNLSVSGGTLAVAAGRTLSVTVNSTTIGTTISAGSLSFADTAAYAGGSAMFTVSGTGSVSVGSGDFTAGAMTITSTAAPGFQQNNVNAPLGNQTAASISVADGSTMIWNAGTQGGDLDIADNVEVLGTGSLNFNSKNVRIGGSITGNITFMDLVIPSSRTLTRTAGSGLTVLRHLTIENGGSYNHNDRPLTLGGGSVTIGTFTDLNTGANPLQNLGAVTLASGGGATTKTLGSALLMSDLEIDANVNLAAGGFALTIDGDAFGSTGTLSGSGSLTVDPAGNQSIAVGEDLSLSTVNLSGSTVQLEVGGSMSTPLAGFTAGNSTVTFNGASNTAMLGYSFHNLVMHMGAAGTTLTPSAGITVANALTLTRGDFRAGSYTHNIAGDWDSSAGDVTWNATSAGMSTINLTSPSAIILKATDRFYNVTMPNANSATISGPLNVLSNLEITDVGGTLILADADSVIDGDVSGSGLLNAAAISSGNSLDLNGDLSINSFTAGASTTLTGDWSVTNFAHSSGTVTLDGTASQSITTNNQTWYNLAIGTRAAGNTVTFTGELNVSNAAAGLTTGTGAYAIEVNDGGTVANNMTFANTGTLTLNTAAGETFTAEGGLTATEPSSVRVAGTIATTGTNMALGSQADNRPVILTQNTTLTTGAGNGNLTLGPVNGGTTARSLEIIAGSGSLVANGELGTTNALESLTLSSAGNATFARGINSNGAISLANSGVLTLADPEGNTDIATVNIQTTTGNFEQTGSSRVDVAADLSIAGTTTFNNPVVLTGNVAAALIGNATFVDTIDDNNDGTAYSLAFTENGNRTFSAAIGNATPIGDLTLSGNGTKTFDSSVVLNSTSGDLTINGNTGLVHFQNTFAARRASQTNGANPIQFDGNVTLDSGTSSFLGNVTLDGLIFSSAGNVTFGTGPTTDGDTLTLSTGPVTLTGTGSYTVYSTINGAVDLTLSGGSQTAPITGSKTFHSAIGAGTALLSITQTDGSGPVSFNANVTTASLTTYANASFGSMTLNASVTVQLGSAPAGSDTVTLTGATTWSGAATYTINAPVSGNNNLTLSGAGSKTFNAAVGATTAIGTGTGAAITQNGTGDIAFNSTVNTASGISQTDGVGSLSFSGNVTIAAGNTASTFLGNLAFNTGSAAVSLTSANSLQFGNAPADTIALEGTNILTLRTTGADAAGRIDLHSAVNGNGIETTSLTIDNSGLLVSHEDADIALTGSAAFDQTGAGAVMLAGSVTTGNAVTPGGAITFARDTYLYGTTGTMRLASEGNPAADSIRFGQNLHIAADGKTIELASPLRAEGSLALYAGNIEFSGAGTYALSAGADLVLLNARGNQATMYDDSAANQSGVAGLFAYDHSARGTATAPEALTLANAFPDASFTFPAAYTGTIAGATLNGKTILTEGNFYANGVDLAATAAWTLQLAENDSATAAFAEAYNLTVAYSTVAPISGTHAWVSAAEATDGANNTGWAFSRPFFMNENTAVATGSAGSGTYTVFDDVIRVEFRDGAGNPRTMENSNNEISAAVTHMRWNGGALAFDGAWTDPECTQTTDGAGDLSSFYLKTAVNGRWNTDATGSSEGDAQSTDRGRPSVAPAHWNTRPDISIPKALDGLYQTLRDTYKNRIAHYVPAPGIGRYEGTADRTRPVLVEVRTGQELHNPTQAAQRPYDAHNFIEFRYSEPVDIGDFDSLPAEANWPIPYARAQTSFAAPGELGGAAQTDGSGVTVAGFATLASGRLDSGYRGAFDGSGTPAATDGTVHGLYRDFSVDGTAAPVTHEHRIRLSVAGWAEETMAAQGTAWKWFYQGYIDETVTPSGAVTVPANANIRDRAAYRNPVEATSSVAAGYGATDYDKYAPSVNDGAVATTGALYGNWDTSPPMLAGVKTASEAWEAEPPVVEVNPTTNAAGNINRLEMNFFDNEVAYALADSFRWLSRTGWYVSDPASIIYDAPHRFGGSRPNTANGNWTAQPAATHGGVRDSSFVRAEGGFRVRNFSSIATGSEFTGFSTEINSAFYNIATTLSLQDDPYVSLDIDTAQIEWSIANSVLEIQYVQTGAFVTDLAGNRMRAMSDYKFCIDRTPPRITLTVTGVGRNDMLVLFSKNLDEATVSTAGMQIELAGGTTVTPQTVDFATDGNRQALRITLPDEGRPTTAQMLDTASVVRLQSPLFADTLGNQALDGSTHRISDIGLGVLETLYASDGVNEDGVFGQGEGALRVFDGTGRLLDRNITVGTRLTTGGPAPLPLTMFFDAAPAPATFPTLFNQILGSSSTLWLPGIVSGFNRQGNGAARSRSPDAIIDADRTLRNFTIPAADDEMVPGSRMELVFRYGSLYLARLADENDLTSLAPWSFTVTETKKQRGGVTIFNNVIDSTKRERTSVQVDVPRSGNIVIQIFTLDGNLLKTLERGMKGAGTYTYYWDGTNNAGRAVARGMYFIRVVGPDIDEIRKVMVIKE